MIRNVRTLALTAPVAALPVLSACGPQPDPNAAPQAGAPAASGSTQPTTVIGKAMGGAIEKARSEINEGNITVSDGDNKPKAEITPQGDLLIDGKAVAVTPEQRALLKEHRQRVAEVALAGVAIGMQGADLATKAVAESLKGVFTGNTDDIEKRIEAEADKIRQSTVVLCDRLPAMRESQQKLAQSLPAFAPYATMTQDDVDDCRDEAKDVAHGNAPEEAAQASAEPPAPSKN